MGRKLEIAEVKNDSNMTIGGKRMIEIRMRGKKGKAVSREQAIKEMREQVEIFMRKKGTRYSIGITSKFEELSWRSSNIFKIKDYVKLPDDKIIYDGDGSTTLSDPTKNAGGITDIVIRIIKA